MTTHSYVSYEKEAIGDVTFQTLLYPVKPGEKVEIHVEKLPVWADPPELLSIINATSILRLVFEFPPFTG